MFPFGFPRLQRHCTARHYNAVLWHPLHCRTMPCPAVLPFPALCSLLHRAGALTSEHCPGPTRALTRPGLVLPCPALQDPRPLCPPRPWLALPALCTASALPAGKRSALQCRSGHCTALHCTPLHTTALHCTALHCTALLCTPRLGRARHRTPVQCGLFASFAQNVGHARSVVACRALLGGFRVVRDTRRRVLCGAALDDAEGQAVQRGADRGRGAGAAQPAHDLPPAAAAAAPPPHAAGIYGVCTLFGVIPPLMAWQSRATMPQSPQMLPGGNVPLVLMTLSMVLLITERALQAAFA